MDELKENEPNLFMGPNGRFIRWFGWLLPTYIIGWILAVWLGSL